MLGVFHRIIAGILSYQRKLGDNILFMEKLAVFEKHFSNPIFCKCFRMKFDFQQTIKKILETAKKLFSKIFFLESVKSFPDWVFLINYNTLQK